MDRQRQIKTAFEANRDAARAAAMAAYMRDQFDFLGLATPLRRQLSRRIIQEVRREAAIDWAFLDACWAEAEREFQYFVLDCLLAVKKKLVFEDIPRLEKYIQTKQWWDTIDGLDGLIGEIGLRDTRVKPLMLAWSTQADFWYRRIAINHQLNYKDRTDHDVLAQIILNNLGSDEFFINKAIGWSLREYSKINPDWVRGFLSRHADQLARLSIREASKYI